MDRPHRKRLIRINQPGHIHELTFSCHRRLPLLSRELTRGWLIEALDSARTNHHFFLLAYVIMPEHVHILIQPREFPFDVSGHLKSIKQPVARKASHWLRQHNPGWHARLSVRQPDGKTTFRFWQAGGGYDRNIVDENTLLHGIAYIHNNPVRRGLASTPDEWPWSRALWYERGEGFLEMDPLP